ncbi:MAG: hypothetical protein HFH45_00260 [Bacilli bacterium]|nr:hypothetical protein [Bacilli bacterium]
MYNDILERNPRFIDALKNIVSAKLGALIIIGGGENLNEIMDGGFYVNQSYSPEKIFELAKLDGAIILNSSMDTIIAANVQLLPLKNIQTFETGMRHRTAERVAKQLDCIAVAVSQRKGIITVYQGDKKDVVGLNNGDPQNYFAEKKVNDSAIKSPTTVKYKVNKRTHRLLLADKLYLAVACKTFRLRYGGITMFKKQMKEIYYNEDVQKRPDRISIMMAAYKSYKAITPHAYVYNIPLGDQSLVDLLTDKNVLDTNCYVEILDLAFRANENFLKQKKKSSSFDDNINVVSFNNLIDLARALAPIFKDEIVGVLEKVMELDLESAWECIRIIVNNPDKTPADLRVIMSEYINGALRENDKICNAYNDDKFDPLANLLSGRLKRY